MCRTRCLLVLVALCMGLAHSWAKISFHIKDSDDLKDMLAGAGEKLVVIDFMAASCGHSTRIGPKLEEMATEMADAIVVLKVDLDRAECKDLETEYNIYYTPTFVFVKNSNKIEEFSGANVDKLRNTIIKLK